jgi:hypothetical protein
MRNYKKRIAPRLASGDKRATIGHGLPPHIKRGLAMLAYRQRQSVSWLLEQMIIDTFRFDVPTYVIPKTDLNLVKKQKAG